MTVESPVGDASGWCSMISSAERSLGGWVSKCSGRLRAVRRGITGIHLAHRGICPGSSSQPRGQSITVRWSRKLLVEAPESTRSGGERGRSRRACDRAGTHAKSRWWIHGGGEAGFSDNSRSRTGGTAAQAVDILGKVVIATSLRATLPVAGAEGHRPTAASHYTGVAHAVSTVADVRGKH